MKIMNAMCHDTLVGTEEVLNCAAEQAAGQLPDVKSD
jgi:hypothetical protein